MILCATRRLARTLRLGAPGGVPACVVPQARTLREWLSGVVEAAILSGELPVAAAPRRVLSDLQERLLWKQVVSRALRGRDDAPLFSFDGLAACAQEAHALAETWGIGVPAAASEEQKAFAEWRRRFLRLCDDRGWRDGARHFVWLVDQVAAGVGHLPAVVERAGFDRLDPQEERLFAALGARGVAVVDRAPEVRSAPALHACADAATQFRAMARWTAERLSEAPSARVGLVVPDLERHRDALCRALDAELDPAALTPAAAQAPRRYNVSLGDPLGRIPLVATALALLRFGLGGPPVGQGEIGRLLLGSWWSADVAEADGRAILEARCRRKLPATTRVAAVARLARRSRDDGVAIEALCTHLDRLSGFAARAAGRRPHSVWATEFRSLLEALGWPGERPLSSADFQARDAFHGCLGELAGLDPVLGDAGAGEALAILQDICMRQLFQPQTTGRPRVEVLGVLEAAGDSFDALWVANLDDEVWPPPARPNPLLPAALQRARGCPNASPEVQRAFAAGIHRRLLAAAPRVVLSYRCAEGERGLRPSPLLAGLAASEAPAAGPPLAERLRRAAGDATESFVDAVAPPVADAARLPGGTWLLRAQAICPAWAFYQYRLGAEALETPADGLDPRARGTLLHGTLEAFWSGRDSATVRAWSSEARRDAVREAVVAALAAHDAANPAAPVPPRLAALERERLEALVAAWVEFELTRSVDFAVVACEERHELAIEGIAARVTVDRIDALPDGRRVVIDYKTGARVDASSWAEPRIVEPQLPIYATWTVAPAPLAAIAFAQVRADAMRFVGVAESPGLLPRVPALAEARGLFDDGRFPDWPSVLAHWRAAVSAIAAEVRSGDARVVFADERALEHCPVKPILRLAERRLQRAAEGGA